MYKIRKNVHNIKVKIFLGKKKDQRIVYSDISIGPSNKNEAPLSFSDSSHNTKKLQAYYKPYKALLQKIKLEKCVLLIKLLVFIPARQH